MSNVSATTSQTRRAVGRPRKRKKSCIVSRRDSLDEKLLTEKLAKLDDSSSLNTSSSEAMDDDSRRCDGSRVADGNRSEISQDLEAVEFEVHRALDDMLTVLAFRSESMLPERDVEWASVEACVTDILDNFNVLS
ncbi:hypothetical protein Tcan_12829 [Toxocara canis]|uniref:Uncharacterized protein n=1 Tax=Toxocara canis TaxID=6265 RepID=A0A0B2USP2_TOXCA|nr:hypothetical protein Tcan_12829 [Toxocara canis]